MGCECTKFGTSSKVTPGDVPLNRSVPNPANNWIEHQINTRYFLVPRQTKPLKKRRKTRRNFNEK
jgi:hypothetical protein